jgi:hypothetical protein
MKKTVLLILVCILIQSCNSQEKDLAKITFTEKYDIFFGNIPNKFELSVSGETYSGYYTSESDEILNFNGVNLSGYKTKEGAFGTNSVSFAFTKKDHTLCNYIIDLNTEELIQKLINVLNSKFGKPKFADKLDLNEKLPDTYIWKDKQIVFLLMGATQNSASLTVFDLKYEELHSLFSGPFQYYEDYLEYLIVNHKTEREVSYYSFAKIMEADGEEYYLQNYVKP